MRERSGGNNGVGTTGRVRGYDDKSVLSGIAPRVIQYSSGR